MRSRRLRSRRAWRAWRLMEMQRRAAYQRQLRQQYSMTPKQKKERNRGCLLACLIIIALIAASMVLTLLFVPRTIPSTTTPYGNGGTIECRDGTYSHAGGRRGACSYHGGETYP